MRRILKTHNKFNKGVKTKMKKVLLFVTALLMCMAFCACNGVDGDSTTAISTEPPTAREQLTEPEEKLFTYLIGIFTDDFYDPAAARILEICDYQERTKYENTEYHDSLFGPDTVVVRIQGKSKLRSGEDVSLIICLKSAENKSDSARSFIQSCSLASILGSDNKSSIMKYKATEGEYAVIYSYNEEDDASDTFNISRINKALIEYWEEMGLN